MSVFGGISPYAPENTATTIVVIFRLLENLINVTLRGQMRFCCLQKYKRNLLVEKEFLFSVFMCLYTPVHTLRKKSPHARPRKILATPIFLL